MGAGWTRALVVVGTEMSDGQRSGVTPAGSHGQAHCPGDTGAFPQPPSAPAPLLSGECSEGKAGVK